MSPWCLRSCFPAFPLKELELLKEVLAGARTTFVFGSGDIAEQVRGLVAQPKDDG